MSLHIKTACLLACTIISFNTSAQKQKFTDTHGSPMLLGEQGVKELKHKPYSEWFKKNYNEYSPNDTAVAALKEALNECSITVFLGSWCGDSKREVPRLLKVLDAAKFSKNNIHLIFVDDHDSAYKQSPGHEEAGKYIYRVPTIIIQKHGADKGRIVEHPVQSLEKDMLQICNGADYKPAYTAGLDVWKKLSDDSLHLKDSVSIIAAYKDVLTRHSELNALGYVLLGRREFDKAIACFKINLLFFNDDANLWDSLADALETAGRHEESIEAWKKVLALDPQNERAKKALGK